MVNSKDLRIRLIEVLPQGNLMRLQKRERNSDQDVEGNLQLVSCTTFSTWLASAPPYKALSYTWGDPKIVAPIMLDGNKTEVTTNLEAALRHFATTISDPLTIWIDAISINQQDEKEKTEQVGRMRDIYSQAEETIAWLGRSEDPAGTRLALQWIEERGSQAVELAIGSKPEMMLRNVLERIGRSSGGSERSAEHTFADNLMKELDSQANPQYSTLIAALQKIMDRPYWSRIWVVQEVRKSRKLSFVCPEGVLEPRTLDRALRLLRNFRQWQLMKHGSATQAHSLDPHRTQEVLQTNPSHALNLFKVKNMQMYATSAILRRLQEFQATDPRDRVFALLSLSPDAERMKLAPDYSLTCEQVYTHFARKMLESGALEILENCICMSYRVGAKLNLQSWVPDWTIPSTRWPLQELGVEQATMRPQRDPGSGAQKLHFLQPEFRASGERDWAQVEAAAWNDPLVYSVIEIGRVCLIGEPARPGNIGHWLQTVQNLAQAAECRHSHSAGEAVWRTAVADQEVRNARYKPRLGNDMLRQLEARFSGTMLASLRSQDFVDNDLGSYAVQSDEISRNRRPFVLSSGHVGIGPKELALGDFAFVLLGASVPYILRSQTHNRFVIIGSAYVHECMDGEAADGDAIVQTIELH